MEIWKDVVGYEGIYKVSNLGRVMRLERIKVRNIDGKDRKFTYKEKLLKQSVHDAGYKIVSLTNNGHRKLKYVHRLVARSFIDNPDNKSEVNHKNGIKDDNRIENLEWCTHKENIIHCCDNGFGNRSNGDDHYCSVLTNSQVKEIRSTYKKTDIRQKDLAEKYDCSVAVINHIIHRRTYKSI